MKLQGNIKQYIVKVILLMLLISNIGIMLLLYLSQAVKETNTIAYNGTIRSVNVTELNNGIDIRIYTNEYNGPVFVSSLITKYIDINEVKYPAIVKPCKCGSSLGINVVNNKEELLKAVEIAKKYDNNIIIEKCLTSIKELECAILETKNKFIISNIGEIMNNNNWYDFDSKYKNKTEYKGVAGKEVFYSKEKAKFNALYGMTVTNTIRDEVYFREGNWSEEDLTNSQIFDKLLDEEEKGFLSFAWGVWVTAYARRNLLERVVDLDEYVVYCDTDSIKLVQGYDKNVFEAYNESVLNKIRTVAKLRQFPLERYCPKDKKGREHYLGVFECETSGDRIYTYDKFITQGAKKYCVEIDGKIEITVSGVPKCGAACLNKVEDFKDNLVFSHEKTNKNFIVYNDSQIPIDMVDYKGVKLRVGDRRGSAILPTTYELSKSIDYADLLSTMSSKRAKFKL
jgi:hypothetical protein